MTKKRKSPHRKPRKADYGKATPEQVAQALHRYRPGRSAAPEKGAGDPAPVNPST